MWGGRKTNQGTSLSGAPCQDLQPLTVIFGLLGTWIPSHICPEALKAGKHSVLMPQYSCAKWHLDLNFAPGAKEGQDLFLLSINSL